MNFRNISSWAIRNPVFPLVLFAALTLAGSSASCGWTSTTIRTSSFPAAR